MRLQSGVQSRVQRRVQRRVHSGASCLFLEPAAATALLPCRDDTTTKGRANPACVRNVGMHSGIPHTDEWYLQGMVDRKRWVWGGRPVAGRAGPGSSTVHSRLGGGLRIAP